MLALAFFPAAALADNPGTGPYYEPGLTGYESPSSQGWGGGTSFADVVAYVIGTINSIVVVLSGLALLLFLWGAFKYVYTAGAKKNRKAIIWSLIALFVLFSIWGILRLACTSLLGSISCN